MYRVIPMTQGLGSMLWDSFREHLELAVVQHPGESMEDIEHLRGRVRNGSAMVIQIFEGIEPVAIAVVEFLELRDGKALHVRYLSGNGMDGWLDELHAKLGEIARAYHCQWISLTGRMGWKKALSRLGYNPVAIQLRAEVAA